MAPTGRNRAGASVAIRLAYSTQLRSDIRTVMTVGPPWCSAAPVAIARSCRLLDSFNVFTHLDACRLDCSNLSRRPLMWTAYVVHGNPSDQIIVVKYRGNHFRADAVLAGNFFLGCDIGGGIEA